MFHSKKMVISSVFFCILTVYLIRRYGVGNAVKMYNLWFIMKVTVRMLIISCQELGGYCTQYFILVLFIFPTACPDNL
jgi:hypothetical protein